MLLPPPLLAAAPMHSSRARGLNCHPLRPPRATCNEVMRVLRTNKDSVMAMLEAFVHDPLINWRLLNTVETSVTEAMAGGAGWGPCSCSFFMLNIFCGGVCWLRGYADL